MNLHLAKAYINGLYDLADSGLITFQEARRIEDEVLPTCERCGAGPVKVIDNGVLVCAMCAMCALEHFAPPTDKHTTEA